jgi:hypothetical protein
VTTIGEREASPTAAGQPFESRPPAHVPTTWANAPIARRVGCQRAHAPHHPFGEDERRTYADAHHQVAAPPPATTSGWGPAAARHRHAQLPEWTPAFWAGVALGAVAYLSTRRVDGTRAGLRTVRLALVLVADGERLGGSRATWARSAWPRGGGRPDPAPAGRWRLPIWWPSHGAADPPSPSTPTTTSPPHTFRAGRTTGAPIGTHRNITGDERVRPLRAVRAPPTCRIRRPAAPCRPPSSPPALPRGPPVTSSPPPRSAEAVLVHRLGGRPGGST